MSLWSAHAALLADCRSDSCGVAGSVTRLLLKTTNRGEEEVTADFEEPQGDRSR
jgi:hypothetical protein